MLKVKPFLQTAGFCGPASLKMVLDFFGIKKSEKELIKLSGASREKGVGAKGLLKAAKKLGLKSFIKDFADFSDIKKYLAKEIPVIVDWFSQDEGHYSVVVGLDQKYIYLQDPQIAKIKKIDLKTFKRVWFDFPGQFLKRKNDIIIRRLIVVFK